MNYKLQGMLENGKKKIIIFAILWLVIIILGVAPFAAAVAESTQVGAAFNFEIFFEQLGRYITSPFSTLGVVFGDGYVGTFGSCVFYFSIFYLAAVIVGLLKAVPKNEYTDIEHGSSGWAEHGEQYKVLSKNKGIVLAEKNYLPVDKRGNVNVLVVRRFWCW